MSRIVSDHWVKEGCGVWCLPWINYSKEVVHIFMPPAWDIVVLSHDHRFLLESAVCIGRVGDVQKMSFAYSWVWLLMHDLLIIIYMYAGSTLSGSSSLRDVQVTSHYSLSSVTMMDEKNNLIPCVCQMWSQTCCHFVLWTKCHYISLFRI